MLPTMKANLAIMSLVTTLAIALPAAADAGANLGATASNSLDATGAAQLDAAAATDIAAGASSDLAAAVPADAAAYVHGEAAAADASLSASSAPDFLERVAGAFRAGIEYMKSGFLAIVEAGAATSLDPSVATGASADLAVPDAEAELHATLGDARGTIDGSLSRVKGAIDATATLDADGSPQGVHGAGEFVDGAVSANLRVALG